MRTPLNGVLGMTQAMARDPLSARQRARLAVVHDSGAALLDVINAVLDISRIEAGKMTLAAAPFDLRHMAESLVKVWTPRASERGVLLVLDLADLPEPCIVRADGGKIEQALVNLVSNAVKFSPAGGAVTIRLAGEAKGGDLALTLQVADEGPGVSAEDRERIFGAYEQTELGRGAGGAGLGLAICAGNLSLMGGAIGVGDAPGGGALFTLTFTAPAAEAEAAADIEGDPILDEARPLRVLAAEDNAANRHVLSALLGPLPIELVLTENGAQALEALAAGRFDLVLMDVNMPVMDGLTALKAIRTGGGGSSAATPVWMLTANVFEEDVARYRAAGADGVLRKPIDLDELFGAIQAAAGRAEVREAEAA
jgi:CheY-like chemotaxis protein